MSLDRLLHSVLQAHLKGDLKRFIADWPQTLVAINEGPPDVPSVKRWLNVLPGLATTDTASLVARFVQQAGEQHWRQTYTASEFGEEFLKRYGYIEIVGRRSALFSDRMASGLLMFGPEIHYPEHRHPAEEIYLPIAGTAEYLMEDGRWQAAAPGTVIHNRPMVKHALRTISEPVLIAWVWLGGDPAVRSEIL